MALRHSDDTEFNDALRARGILPPLPSNSPPPSPPAAPTDPLSRLQATSSSDSLTLESLEDELPQSTLEAWRAAKAAEISKREQLTHARGRGGVRPIGREEYVREVNEASERNLEDYVPGEEEDDGRKAGTGVVLCLHNSAAASGHLLNLLDSLSTLYPRTTFLSIPGTSCIPNYPEKNHPTLLCYRKGELACQVVGLSGGTSGLKGLQTTVSDLEVLLLSKGLLDADLKDLNAARASERRELEQKQMEEDDEWDLDDTRLGRSKGRSIKCRTKDEDSDLDI